MRLFSVLFAGILAATPVIASAQLNSGLVAHWPFSGNAGDSSGNTFNGTSLFISYGQGENGVNTTAASFNGTSSHINVGYQAGLNLTQYTICAIVKPTGYYTGQCQGNVIMQRSNETMKGYYGILFSDNAYNDCFTTDTSKFVFYPSATAANPAILQYTPNIVSNTWYTLVATCNNDTIKFYVNGQLKASYITNNPTGTSTEGLTIGALYQQTAGGSFPYWFKGLIDDIRIYNRVLTNKEIKQYSSDVYFAQAYTSLCKSTTFDIKYNTVNEFPTANVFSVELSDASGSFASPVVIGTTTAARGGTISCSIPGSTPIGSGYRVRIKSSLPVKISDTMQVAIGIPTAPPTAALTVAPGLSVASGVTAFFSAIATNAGTSPTYIWKKNGITLTGISGFTLSAKAGLDFVTGDTFTVVVKSNTICAIPDSAESNKTGMTVIPVSVTSVNGTQSFGIHPNPSNGTFTINAGNIASDKVEIEIKNKSGQLVHSEQTTVVGNKLAYTVRLPHIAAGVYYVTIKTADQQTTQKLLLQ
jgi:hypothetical protein